MLSKNTINEIPHLTNETNLLKHIKLFKKYINFYVVFRLLPPSQHFPPQKNWGARDQIQGLCMKDKHSTNCIISSPFCFPFKPH